MTPDLFVCRLLPLCLAGIALLMLGGNAASAPESRPAGTWYLNANGQRLTLVVAAAQTGSGYSAAVISPRGVSEAVEAFRWDPGQQSLEFRRRTPEGWEWYRGREVEGVLVGRFSQRPDAAVKPEWPEGYPLHVTGWNATVLDAQNRSRVYELVINGDFRARLRLDRGTEGALVGRLKVYSTVSRGSAGEEVEDDLEVTHWDGKEVRFIRHLPGADQVYTGRALGRSIRGTFTVSGQPGAYDWSGERAEVLGYGLLARSDRERLAWQERTRRRLMHLIMAGNPAPLKRTVRVLGSDLPPLPSTRLPVDRDDDPAAHPQNYRLSELQIEYELPNPTGGAPLRRTTHAYLARPQGPPPRGGFPVVLAVNGHSGSAWKMLNPDDPYFWHGDAFARRGYVVLAVDISHRPPEDRRGLYGGYVGGDDPEHGCGPHPAIRAEGMDSDWEEDGERAWDAMRALDYLLTLPDVNPKRALVTGISMGGEVTTYTAALDPRLAISIPVGYSPDMGVMKYNGNHPCWGWTNAEIREYLDVSDLLALAAPRPMVLQTGRKDFTFSRLAAPFAGDVQIARRVRAAYGSQSGRFVHYLHYDQHHYHVGDVNPSSATERWLQVPAHPEPPAPFSRGWETDPSTRTDRRTLFQWIEGCW